MVHSPAVRCSDNLTDSECPEVMDQADRMDDYGTNQRGQVPAVQLHSSPLPQLWRHFPCQQNDSDRGKLVQPSCGVFVGQTVQLNIPQLHWL